MKKSVKPGAFVPGDPSVGASETFRAFRHEINNPLASLILNVEMLKEGGHKDTSDLVVEIERAAKRIATIVERLEGGGSRTPPRERRRFPDSVSRAPGATTILLVDDEESVRAVVTKVLLRHGHRVLEAEHGADAMRLVAGYEGNIDLLITDMYMPGLRGPEVVEKLSAMRPGLKVLYMSGYAAEDIARSEVDPMVPFLHKPFTVQELSEAVETALSHSGNA